MIDCESVNNVQYFICYPMDLDTFRYTTTNYIKPTVKSSANNLQRQVTINSNLPKLYHQQHVQEMYDTDYGRSFSTSSLSFCIRDIKTKYNAYKYSAQKRNIGFQLNFKECTKLFTQPCYYCGLQPQYNRLTGLNGIDRKDSDGDYTLNNVVASCSTCNMAKGVLMRKDFIAMAQHITLQKIKRKLAKSQSHDKQKLYQQTIKYLLSVIHGNHSMNDDDDYYNNNNDDSSSAAVYKEKHTEETRKELVYVNHRNSDLNDLEDFVLGLK